MNEGSPPQQVSIIGAGVIGAAWAARWLLRGSDVAIYDPSPETERTVTEVLENARYAWQRLDTAPESEGSLSFSKSLGDAVDGAQLIQESTPEDLNFKKSIFAQIESCADNAALIASSE